MLIPARLLPHRVIVEPYLGSGAYGDVHGDPVEHRAYVEDGRRLVRDEHGAEVVSETTVRTRPRSVSICCNADRSARGGRVVLISATVLIKSSCSRYPWGAVRYNGATPVISIPSETCICSRAFAMMVLLSPWLEPRPI